MKKFFILLLILMAVLVAILFIRAETVFNNNQYQVGAPLQPIELNENAVVERFAKSIRYQTISYEDTGAVNEAAFLDLHQHLVESFPLTHQFANKTVINQFSLVFHLPGRDPSLKPVLFMGHMDVVPIDSATQNQWQIPPFSGAVLDGEIWGRGTIDDKISVLALMEAMEQLIARDVHRHRDIYFAFGHDEEIGGNRGAKAIAAHFAAKNIEFDFVLDEGGAITEGIIPGVQPPVALVGVAEKGFVNLRLSVNAPGGHSSQPPKNTAAGILSQAVVKLEQDPFPSTLQFFNLMFDAVGFSTPLKTRLPMANLWLFSPLVTQSIMASPGTAASAHTTTAVTMLRGSDKSNVLPTQAEAVVNFRILPGDSIDLVKTHAERVIDDPRVKISAFMGNEASNISPTNSLGFELIEQTIRRLDDQVLVAPYLVQGGTDAKHYSELSDNIYRFLMVRLNSNSIKRLHGLNERIAVKDYIDAVQFFYALLEQSVSEYSLRD